MKEEVGGIVQNVTWKFRKITLFFFGKQNIDNLSTINLSKNQRNPFIKNRGFLIEYDDHLDFACFILMNEVRKTIKINCVEKKKERDREVLREYLILYTLFVSNHPVTIRPVELKFLFKDRVMAKRGKTFATNVWFLTNFVWIFERGVARGQKKSPCDATDFWNKL